VHDKVVRRRRAVLALLVTVSLILLTAYFGESPNSPLHSVQRGIVQVLSPVQSGASKVLSPVRDVANWVSDTLRAKSQRDQLLKQVDHWRQVAAENQAKAEEYPQLARLLALDDQIGASAYHPVGADVIGRDPLVWYQTIFVDKGSDDGVVDGDPVIGDDALVGDVTTVDPSESIVTLISDHTLAVAARVQDGGSGDTGLLVPAVGSLNTLLLQDLPGSAPIANGDLVVTAGFKSGTLEDLYPSGIPIGTVTGFDPNTLQNDNQVSVSPSADLRHLDVVQILTRPQATDVRAQVP
jgi:rod shape-determining protein MreC